MFADVEQTVVLPVMSSGWAGMLFTVTANVCAADDPQVTLLAVTEMFPLVALAVVVIVVVVDVPVQPLGKVHV